MARPWFGGQRGFLQFHYPSLNTTDASVIKREKAERTKKKRSAEMPRGNFFIVSKNVDKMQTSKAIVF